jgi:erythromycin esterase
MTLKLIMAGAMGLTLVVAPHADPVVDALDEAARPLHALAATVRDAEVVGVGEATHGTHEFFALQTRLFARLAPTFGTFAREVSWSGGLRIDDYVVHGIGDPRQIMREEFQGYYQWNTREYLNLIEWMRAYNERHPNTLRFMGDDIGYPGPQLFERIRAGESRPWLVAELDRLYDGMAPVVGPAEWMATYPSRPLADRQSMRDRAWQAVDLLLHHGSDEWTVQHARVVAQSMTMWASDPMTGFRYRDEAMAENILWWRDHVGDRIVLAAHDSHVATESYMANFPRVQGTVLRERLGEEYVSVGTTFHHGEFTFYDGRTTRTVTAGPPSTGTNESTVDQVGARNFVLDVRSAPPAARDWLASARPTRQYANQFPVPDKPIALGRSFDVVVHIHRMTPAWLLP